MQDFFEALTSKRKNIAIPDEFNYFGKLIGSWKINYIDNNESCVINGQWHFSWVLEARKQGHMIVLTLEKCYRKK